MKTNAGKEPYNGPMAKRKTSSAHRTRARQTARVTRQRRPPKQHVVARSGTVTVAEIDELDDLRHEIERAASGASPLRWNADPDDVQRSVAQLVLTLVEFIRKLLERQAIRRMDAGTLTDHQTEEVGRALMKLEETVRDIAAKFGVSLDELNLDLGPIGKLM